VWENDPGLCSAIEALEITGTIGEAAKHMGISDGEFTRYRNRLKQLGECFQNDTPVPKQRRPYKKRAKTGDQPSLTP
jgi:molybdenum-dependent DNA-binding transcriptional regulator ModE